MSVCQACSVVSRDSYSADGKDFGQFLYALVVVGMKVRNKGNFYCVGASVHQIRHQYAFADVVTLLAAAVIYLLAAAVICLPASVYERVMPFCPDVNAVSLPDGPAGG